MLRPAERRASRFNSHGLPLFKEPGALASWVKASALCLAAAAIVAFRAGWLPPHRRALAEDEANRAAVCLVLSGDWMMDVVRLRDSLAPQRREAPLPVEIGADEVRIPLGTVPTSSALALMMHSDRLAETMSLPEELWLAAMETAVGDVFRQSVLGSMASGTALSLASEPWP